MKYITLKDIGSCSKCPWRLLVHSKRPMRFSPIPKHQQNIYDSLQNTITEPCSNHMSIIFLIIHEGSWISHWFLFFPLMKFIMVTLKAMSKLLLSIQYFDLIIGLMLFCLWTVLVMQISFCHYHQEVSSCNWAWPSRTGW